MDPPPTPPRDNNVEKNPNEAFETYHNIAETIGGLPTVRKKDNLIQGLAILITTALGAAVGGILYGLWRCPRIRIGRDDCGPDPVRSSPHDCRLGSARKPQQVIFGSRNGALEKRKIRSKN